MGTSKTGGLYRELLAGEKKTEPGLKHIPEPDSGNGIPEVPDTGQTVSVTEAVFARKRRKKVGTRSA